MAKIITFSTTFPSYHPQAGEPTWFVEKILNSVQDFSMVTNELCESQYFLLGAEKFIEFRIKIGFKKHHTIRAGSRWRVGDKFSPRIWSGKPYQSKQIIIAPDIEIKKIWDFEMKPKTFWDECQFYINRNHYLPEGLKEVAANDGLTLENFMLWFAGKNNMDSRRKGFKGQIICWNENINY